MCKLYRRKTIISITMQRRRLSRSVLALIISLSVFLQTSGRCFHERNETARRQVLSCYRSNTYIPELVHSSPGNVTDLIMIYSNVPDLQRSAFQGMDRLKTIMICQCGLKNIDDSAFAGVSALETLTLSNNLLEIIKAIWFEHIPNLKTLIVKRNRISAIEPLTATKWANLQYLDISENKLQCLPPNFMDYLSGLRYINCRQNPWRYNCCYDIMEWALTRDQLVIKPQYKNVQDIHNMTRACKEDQSPSSADDYLSIDVCVENKLDELLRTKIVRSDFL